MLYIIKPTILEMLFYKCMPSYYYIIVLLKFLINTFGFLLLHLLRVKHLLKLLTSITLSSRLCITGVNIHSLKNEYGFLVYPSMDIMFMISIHCLNVLKKYKFWTNFFWVIPTPTQMTCFFLPKPVSNHYQPTQFSTCKFNSMIL